MRVDTPLVDQVNGHLFVGEISVGGIDNYVVCHFNGNQRTNPTNNETMYAPDTTGRHYAGDNSFTVIPVSGKWGSALNGCSLPICWSTSSAQHDFDWVGDYTLDFWMNLPSGNPSYQGIPINVADLMIYCPTWANDMWRLNYDIIHNNGQFNFTYYQNGVVLFALATPNMAAFLDGWHHYAYVKALDQFILYVDGVEIGRSTISSQPTQYSDYSNILTVGNDVLYFPVDEIRFSKGIARWTSNFDVPTAPYVADMVFAGSLMYEDGIGNVHTLNQAHPSASNIGQGIGLFQQIYNNNFRFKTIKAGNNITLSDDGSTIIITGAAQAVSVTSVNGQTGVVTLTSDNIAEGSNNKYYTDVRVDARVTTAVNALKGIANGLATLGSDGKVPATQLPSIVGGSVAISGKNPSGTPVSISAASSIQFDDTTGIKVTDIGGNAVKISLGSGFKTINNPSGTALVAVGEDTYSNITPGSIQIVGDNTVNAKKMTFQLIGDSLTPGYSMYYGTDVTGNKGYYNLPTGGGATSIPGTTRYLKCGKTATQSFTASTQVAVVYVQNAALNMTWDGVNNQCIIPETGIYIVSAAISASSINGTYRLRPTIIVNGTSVCINETTANYGSTSYPDANVSMTLSLSAGDIVKIALYSTVDFTSEASTISDWLTIVKIPTDFTAKLDLTSSPISLSNGTTRTFNLPANITNVLFAFLDGVFLKPTTDFTNTSTTITLDSSIFIENGMTLVVYGSTAAANAGGLPPGYRCYVNTDNSTIRIHKSKRRTYFQDYVCKPI